MFDINAFVNKCFIEIINFESIDLLNKARQHYHDKDILCIFFHYDDKRIVQDHQFIKEFEKRTNFYVNWIDISKLYNETKKLNKSLGFFAITLKNYEEIRYENILTHIKNQIKENFLRFKTIIEYKG